MPLPPIPWLVDTSLRTSIAIVVVLCLRPTLRRWIGSSALAWLWLAIVARLLFSLPVAAPWHVPSLLSPPASTDAPLFVSRVSVAPADAPAIPRIVALPDRASSPQAKSTPDILLVLWLSGVLLVLARLARGWWTIRRWAARTLPADAYPGLQSTYLAIPAELRRGVTLRLTDALNAPTLVGVLHPQIWLPRTLLDTLTPAEFRQVLLHELGHARRRDLPAQWFCSLACCLHWFNPLVWLLARVARTDRELACDAWVLSRDSMKAETSVSYGRTLLKVVEGMGCKAAHALPVVSMAAWKHHLDLRVREIRAFRPAAPWRGTVALGMTTALIAICTFGSAATVVNPDTAVPSASPVAASPSPVPKASTPPAPDPSTRPRQVEIESKFIEVAKSTALQLEKSVPQSSHLASVYRQLFVQSKEQGASGAPRVFRSARVLPDDFQMLVRQLNESKGVDLLSAPRVTTKSGQKATVEIIRQFIYPTAFQRDQGSSDKPVTTPTNFDKKNTGLTLEVTPTIESKGGIIDLSLTWTITNFDGFVDADGKPSPVEKGNSVVQFPVFDTHSVSSVAALSSGATVVFSREEEHLFYRKSIQSAMGETKREFSPAKNDDRLLLVMVTARLVNPPPVAPVEVEDTEDESPAPAAIRPSSQPATSLVPPPAAGTSPGSSDTAAPLIYGVSVPGKPDFAISPYAPDAGYVDLHGFTRGQSVRDPYTGKMFLVP